MIKTGTFGNTQVALLKSPALPAGKLLIESQFRVEAIAPRHFNLPAYLPQQVVRVVLAEGGQDLSKVATPHKLLPMIEYLDKATARQIVKARTHVISDLAERAKATATAQLSTISEQACQQFGDYLDKEISRLTRLQAVNPNVRDDEITTLQKMKEQGLLALTTLSLVPDSIRVLVCIKP